uniref:Transcription initiation factor TFIID subunit 8 n=1 Tax=Romanomermis culicivorax TaxID=13658 RepID=A0A915L6I4_ROMCU
MTEPVIRATLKMCVAALSKQQGFDISTESVIETLTEMLQNITEVGCSSKIICELASRTTVIPSDASLALIEMGLDLNDLVSQTLRRDGYGSSREARIIISREARIIIAAQYNFDGFFRLSARSQPPTIEIKTLNVGNPRPHPSHIANHFPNFPDPHTYLQTPAQTEYTSDYESSRTACSEQQRNIEQSLIRFVRDINPGSSSTLYVGDEAYKIILPVDEPKSYLTALLPQDVAPGDVVEEETDTVSSKYLDNPFLRPVKMPRTVDKAIS